MRGPSAPRARLGATVPDAPAHAFVPWACASGARAASSVAITHSPSATRRARVAVACIARSSLLLRRVMMGGRPPRPGSIMTPSAPLMPPMALSPRAPADAPPVVIPLQREPDERYVGHGVVHDDARHGEQADGQAQR